LQGLLLLLVLLVQKLLPLLVLLWWQQVGALMALHLHALLLSYVVLPPLLLQLPQLRLCWLLLQ
jgi:hypothetical protein